MQKKELLKFRCTGLEKAIIEKKAENSGLSISAYCRKVSLGQKIEYKLTQEELECYTTLSKFHNNFVSISNLLKERNNSFAKEVMQTVKELKAHLKKFQL